jgi:hypothetical protein
MAGAQCIIRYNFNSSKTALLNFNGSELRPMAGRQAFVMVKNLQLLYWKSQSSS